MSMARSSSAVGVLPKPEVGDCASTAGLKACTTSTAPRTVANTKTTERVGALRTVAIRDLSVGRDLPGLDAVVVILGVHAADLDQLGQPGLRVACVVRAARCDDGLLAAPCPRAAKSRVGPR